MKMVFAGLILGLWCSAALVLPTVQTAEGAEFFCPSLVSAGDVSCLIASINDANQNGEENTINLAPGTYTLTSINGTTSNANGLPVISGAMIIKGESAETTIIERDPAAPGFRIFNVDAFGRLTLDGITVRGGFSGFGAGISNSGTLTINYSIIEGNQTDGFGAGIANGGVLTISRSILTRNIANLDGGGIWHPGGTTRIIASSITDNVAGQGGAVSNGAFSSTSTVTIQNSTISGNRAVLGAAGLFNIGNLIITNSTIADNHANAFPLAVFRNLRGGGILNEGMLTITNSTISHNTIENFSNVGGGIANSGTAKLQNTIVALNFAESGLDCSGFLTSLGNNIIGDPSNCSINLLPSDLTGDPGLEDFVDGGTPGNGHFPFRSGSQAIDAANSEACPATDQLGLPRVGVCDIGAVEFQGSRLLVSIDIRPRSDANRINPNSTNNINVAILSVNGFDARTVDPNTVRFGATGIEAAPVHVGRRDVDGDGTRDLVVRFQIPDTGISCGDSSATLTGNVSSGATIIGSSPIRTVQCNTKFSQQVSQR